MARYQFEYEKITCCNDCPLLNVEFYYCPFEYDNRHTRELITLVPPVMMCKSAENKRPDWCKLEEVSQDG